MTVYGWFRLFLSCWHAFMRPRAGRRRRRRKMGPAAGAANEDFRPAPARRRFAGGRPKPPWVIEIVLRLYAETGSYRLARMAFNRQYAHAGMTVSADTVYRWVQKYRSEMEVVRRKTRNRFPAPAPANLRWCLDGTGKRDATGADHFLLGVVDHGTRLNLVLERLARPTAGTILQAITSAVERFGKPRIIRTDNAAVFRSRVFERGLADLGIRHEFSAPGKPWQNGRIERFFLTLKQLLDKIVPTDGGALDRLLPVFSFWYNHVRPHQHLHGCTPAEAWLGIDPYRNAPKSVLRFSGWGGLLTGFYHLRP